MGCDDADDKSSDGEKLSVETAQTEQVSVDKKTQSRRGRGERGRPGGPPDGRSRDPKAGAQFRDRPVPVAVTIVERGRVDAFYASTATLIAEEEAAVVARTQGVVEQIFVEEGDHVVAGASEHGVLCTGASEHCAFCISSSPDAPPGHSMPQDSLLHAAAARHA